MAKPHNEFTKYDSRRSLSDRTGVQSEVKNVSKTPLVAGQWRKRGNGFELVICEDTTAPNVRAQDKLRLLS